GARVRPTPRSFELQLQGRRYAAASMLLALVLLAGCGGGGGGGTTDSVQVATGEGTIQTRTGAHQTMNNGESTKHAEAQKADPGSDSGQTAPASGAAPFESKGGDNSIQRYGSEAATAELTQAGAVLHAYLDARAAEEWA